MPSASDPANRVTAVFRARFIDGAPGCAVAISQSGQVMYARGFGTADLSRKAPITPSTVFDVGSVSKQFTAALILLLAQDGKLSLDDDVHRYVPELPDYGKPMPLRDLMWMESGIPNYLPLLQAAGFDIQTGHPTVAEALAVIATAKLDFSPGFLYFYSNSNYFLLGLVAERVSGKSLADLAQERILDPLGMRATFFQEHPGTPVIDGATSYEVVGADFRPDISPWNVVGPGGLQSTVLDLLRWADNFTTGKVGGVAFLKAQLEPGPAVTDLDGATYDAGVISAPYHSEREIWHNGAWEGFRSELFILPQRHVALVMLCNIGITDADATALAALDAWTGAG